MSKTNSLQFEKGDKGFTLSNPVDLDDETRMKLEPLSTDVLLEEIRRRMAVHKDELSINPESMMRDV